MSEKRLKGWHLLDDKNWEERKKQMMEKHPTSTPPKEAPTSEPLKLQPIVCNPDCIICHGQTFCVDSQEFAIACPNARRKPSGGD